MGRAHARVLAGAGVLARVVDPCADAGLAVAARYGVPWAPELDSVTGVDAVVLAAATPAHHPVALDVVAADVPLLVEKPLCDDLTRAQDVVRLAERRDVPLMCGLAERFNPAVLTAAALIGEPVHVTAVRHSPYAPRIRTGVGWDLLVHDVDLAIRCFGDEPRRVSATAGYFHPSSEPGAEDVLDTVLEFPRGGVASVSASRVGQRRVRSLVVTEPDRVIDVDLLRGTVIVHRGERAERAEPVSGAEPLAAQLDRFLGLVDGSVDAAAERRSILPAHRVVAAALRQRSCHPV